MSKPKHQLPNKTSKKLSKEVRGGLISGDTPMSLQTQPKFKAKPQVKKKSMRRSEKRVSIRTPHADDGTWEKVGESKILSTARTFAKSLIKNSLNKINKVMKGKSFKK